MDTCTIIWTAYNEEFTIGKSIQSVKKSINYAKKKLKEKYGKNIKFYGIICHNGCTDKTPKIVKDLAKKSKKTDFKINVIESHKGVIKAQKKSVEFIEKNQRNKYPIIFIDADTLTVKDTIFVLLEQLIKHPKLKAVGIHPSPLVYKGKNLYKKMMSKILNCKAYFPKSEIAVNFAPNFHPYADSDPQYIGADYEKKSKIYFHGRCFALRNTKIWDVEEDSIGDDTFLDRIIHFRYGPESIRMIYDTHVYFNPLVSLKHYYKTYTRIFVDLEQIKTKHPEFEIVRQYSKTTLDKKYIKSLDLNWRIYFFLYCIIKNVHHFMCKGNIFLIKKDKLWNYETKKEFDLIEQFD